MDKYKLKRHSLILICVLCICGFFLIYRIYSQTNKYLMSEVLLEARLIAESLYLNDIKELTGTTADFEKDAYKDLFKHLQTFYDISENYHYVYIMKLGDDGKPFFVLQFPEDPETPHGSVYEDATKELLALFTNKTPFIEIQKDSYGDFVSPLVPIIDTYPESESYGEVLAIFGIDYDRREWKWTIFGRIFFPLIMLLLMCVTIVLYVRILYNRNEILLRSERIKRQKDALSKFTITDNLSCGGLGYEKVFNKLVQMVAETLDVDKVSIWILNKVENAYICQTMFDAPTKTFTAGKKIIINDYLPYFEYVHHQTIISVEAIEKEPLIADFYNRALYNEPIKSLLTATIRDNGEIIGACTIGNATQYRTWYPDEEAFMGIISALIHQILERESKEKAIIENQRLSAISEMASAFSHDFNNYLQVILTNIEVLCQKLNTLFDVKDYLNTIRITTNDAATRVQILQRFSGTKSTHSQYNRLNINHIISEAVVQTTSIWKTEPEHKGIEIQIKEKLHSVPDIFGNNNELRSVIYNLIKNSVEAMPTGGSITIETGECHKGVYIKVSDTGCGMSDEVAKRVFEPFYTTKGYEAGRGLGLSGVHNIINEHKGSISVASTKLGEGTTFEVILPYHNFTDTPTEPVVAKNLSPIQSIDEKTPKGDEGNATIGNGDQDISATKKRDLPIVLWVDDDPLIRQVGYDMLQMMGYDITVAESGAEALEILATKEIDILLSDIGMPAMNGWQLMDKVHQLYPNKYKRVLISGWGDQISDEEKLAHKIDFIFGKPVKMAQMKQLLEELWK